MDSNVQPNCMFEGSMSDTVKSQKLARNSFGTAYVCQKPWPESCFVQCGEKGVVLSASGSYKTAFFEAFPDTFIRGQGATIEDAEESAWNAYQRQLACPGHDYERRGESEHGACRHCGRFQSHVFKPVHNCDVCSKPHVNLDFYNAHLCLEHYLELARDPTSNGVAFGSEESTPLFGRHDVAQAYQKDVWAAELLLELGLMPADVEDHLVDRYLNGEAIGLNLYREQREFIRGFYRVWISQNPGEPVGGLMFLQRMDSYLAGEAEFKDVTKAVLHAKGLTTEEVSESRIMELRLKSFELFAAAAEDFRQLKQGGGGTLH